MQVTCMLREFVKTLKQKNYANTMICILKWYVTFGWCFWKLYQIDTVKFLSVPRLAWQAALIKTKNELERLTKIDMVLMVLKRTRGGTCHFINRYAKANNKYMKDNVENKESSYLKYCGVNSLYSSAMSQKLLVDGFEWVEDTSQINEDFIKSYNEESDERYFLKVEIQYPENFYRTQNDLLFFPEWIKTENVKMLIYLIKLNILLK